MMIKLIKQVINNRKMMSDLEKRTEESVKETEKWIGIINQDIHDSKKRMDPLVVEKSKENAKSLMEYWSTNLKESN